MLLNDENRKAFGDILANLDTTTTALAKRSADIDATLRESLPSRRRTWRWRRTRSHRRSPTPIPACSKLGKLSDDADAFVNGDGLAQLRRPDARGARAGRAA